MAEPAFSQAINAHGTLLKLGNVFPNPATYTVVAEVIDLTPPGPTSKTFDVSNQSSAGWIEYISGMLDGGKVSFDVNYIPTDATQNASTGLLSLLANRSLWGFQVVFPNTAATTWTFNGIVISFVPTAPVDGILRAKIEIQVSGQPTLA